MWQSDSLTIDNWSKSHILDKIGLARAIEYSSNMYTVDEIGKKLYDKYKKVSVSRITIYPHLDWELD